MTIKVTCSRGHATQVADETAGRPLKCPACGELVNVPGPTGRTESDAARAPLGNEQPEGASQTPLKPAGLWRLMGRDPAQLDAPGPEPAGGQPATAGEPSPPPAADAPTGRSLWSVMDKSAAGERIDRRLLPRSTDESPPAAAAPPAAAMAGAPLAVPAAPHPDPFSQAFPGADRRLRRLAEIDAGTPPAAPPASAPLVSAEMPDLTVEDAAPPIELEEAAEQIRLSGSPAAEEPSEVAIKPTAPLATILGESPFPATAGTARSRRAWLSLLLGALGVPLGLLAIIPSFWSQLPSTILGLAALYLGFIALQEMKRSRGRLGGRGIARAGIGLGMLAMFLGPLVLSPLDLWNRAARKYTEGHLLRIAAGLDGYHRVQGHYPAGNTFAQAAGTDRAPLHGWLTLLLPQLGKQELYGKIDLGRPYDDALNAPVFRQPVPEFLASGASREPVRGLAPAHFAGVGGEVPLEEGSYAHAGLFGETEGITRDDITDGLSQTLVVGEISHELPAWGAPRNWRLIGKGLNRELRGFGNAEGTGAVFLLADGSVRFFAKSTSPELLEQMSTRDGGEPLPADAEPAGP